MSATSCLDFKPSLHRNASFKCHSFDHAVEVNSRLSTITNTSQTSLGGSEKNFWGGGRPPPSPPRSYVPGTCLLSNESSCYGRWLLTLMTKCEAESDEEGNAQRYPSLVNVINIESFDFVAQFPYKFPQVTVYKYKYKVSSIETSFCCLLS